jgi:hypothetical protein
MICVSIIHINSNDLYGNSKNGIDTLRKNFSYMLFIIINKLHVIEVIAIFRYFYFRKKYHFHIYNLESFFFFGDLITNEKT